MNDASPGEAKFHHLLVLANPSSASFDHSVAATYAGIVKDQGQEITVRDLYALGFDPLLKAAERPAGLEWTPSPDVAAELDLVAAADVVVFVYPIWFGLPPAMLKGYVERVIGAGYSVKDVQGSVGQPAVQGKPLITFSTSGASLPWLQSQEQVQSLKAVFDVYLWRGLAMSRVEHYRLDNILPDMSSDYAEEQLQKVRDAAHHVCEMLASGHYRREAEAEAARRARKHGAQA
jgi:NAD(P)H dehydrogenase (quinone)